VYVLLHVILFLFNQHDFQERPLIPTLEDSDAKEVHLGEPMTVYDIEGNPHTFTPRLNVWLLFLVLTCESR
jgi:hypothetical protein